MIENLQNYLEGLAIGIRFRAHFSIEDQLGKIVDKILYSKNSFFNPEVFPVVYTTVKEKTLSNEQTGDKLLITNSDILLEIEFQKYFKREDLQLIFEKFKTEIINGIIKEYNIREINRIGIIKRYIFNYKDYASTFINKTIGNTIEGINDINLKFSKKFPIEEALIKKDINDYYNAIFNVIKKADLDEIFMSIDYQKYFLPSINDYAELRYDEFVEKVENFNNKSYLSWLNKYYGELK